MINCAILFTEILGEKQTSENEYIHDIYIAGLLEFVPVATQT